MEICQSHKAEVELIVMIPENPEVIGNTKIKSKALGQRFKAFNTICMIMWNILTGYRPDLHGYHGRVGQISYTKSDIYHLTKDRMNSTNWFLIL